MSIGYRYWVPPSLWPEARRRGARHVAGDYAMVADVPPDDPFFAPFAEEEGARRWLAEVAEEILGASCDGGEDESGVPLWVTEEDWVSLRCLSGVRWCPVRSRAIADDTVDLNAVRYFLSDEARERYWRWRARAGESFEIIRRLADGAGSMERGEPVRERLQDVDSWRAIQAKMAALEEGRIVELKRREFDGKEAIERAKADDRRKIIAARARRRSAGK